jgi:ectoine hydroxylase-related dioxygenase (phytanoyl-CoA dioxygenase family)
VPSDVVGGRPGAFEGLRRPIGDDEVEAFWRDGVVCLRGVLSPLLVEAMTGPVDALLADDGRDGSELADLSAMGDALAGTDVAGRSGRADGGGRGRFRSGVDHWRRHDAFRAFACDSAIPAVAGTLLRADTVRLWEDSVLVKEPGARERTEWHQDLSYFHVDGDQLCTTWVPLDPTTEETGAMRFARGSHRWGRTFRPNLFVTTTPLPGTDGDEVPDVDVLAAAGEVEVLTFATEPGDLTVHHARTLHAAGPNRSTDRRRRAISIRYCGDDARYRLRPGVPRKDHHARVADGEPLTDPDCPLVWNRRHPPAGTLPTL